ncbi:MAG: DPP IV N-terminal domain-containing protein [Muribaculaceae bacterium]|nr:DPP IV N-terminal domain-containing protein [Muribaculaceae bacterium]
MKQTLMILTACMALNAGAWELQDFVLSQARPAGIGAVQPAADGAFYYQISDNGRDIDMFSYKSATTSKPILRTDDIEGVDVDSWDGYEMSKDESRILLWTASESIYRHSFTAHYYVLDRKSNHITKLSPDGGEEIATLSPDGNKVAYVKANNVYVMDLSTGQSKQITTDGEKNKVIYAVPDWVYQEEFGMLNSFTWSPDSRTLAFIRWDESEVPMYSMTMYEGDCSPNSDNALYPGSFDYKYPVAGEKNSVVNVMTCDVATGTTKMLKEQYDYIPHLAFARNDALMVMTLNRTQNELNIYRMNPADETLNIVYHDTSSTWIDSELARSVTYTDKFLVIPSERSGEAQLYKYSLDTNELSQQITINNTEPVTAYYGYDGKHDKYYYQCTLGPLNRVVRCVDGKRNITDVAAHEGTNRASFSSDFSYYIHSFNDATTPPQYRIVRTRDNKVIRNLELNEEYAKRYNDASVPRREFVTFDNDGYTLNGYIIKPVDFDPTKRYPVIMSQYSGPGSQQVLNNWKVDWETYFATQGFIIACFDGRGTGGRGKAFESVTYMNLGYYETIDQVAAARYMASQPWVDADHIGIWGWSYGGYMTLMALSEPDHPFAAGVSIAPVTSWKFYDTIYAERFMRTPQENIEGYEKSAPLNRMENFKGDLLIMFGSADDNVHIINSMQYIAKLHGKKSQFEMMVYPNMNHSINGCGVREPLYQRVLDFFNSKLK